MSYTVSQDVSLECVAKIVTAYVSNNIIPASELPGLIGIVHNVLNHINGLPHTEQRPVQPRQPAVPVSRSVKPNYIVCLEDGKKLKMLARHLRTAHGLSPEEYCEKWELPENYPMVAAKYSEWRSELAKQIGLSRKSGKKLKARKKATG